MSFNCTVGAPGMQELVDGMTSIVNGKEATNNVFAYPLPYNLIPQIDVFLDNQYTKEEMKVVWESKKIMDAPDMKVVLYLELDCIACTYTVA